MALFNNPEFMWFGTEDRMGWIITPNTGADASSIGNNSTVGLLNGGSSIRHSWDSSKSYQFSWGETANQTLVSLIQGYRNGSYGRGLIHFHDPMHYSTNLLPKRWADPSMAVNTEAESLIPDMSPTATNVGASQNNYPVTAANYLVPARYSSQTAGMEHFIPIPEGMSLILGAAYVNGAGSSRVYYRTPTTALGLLPLLTTTSRVAGTLVNGTWARIGIRNPTATADPLTIYGMTARLIPYTTDPAAISQYGEGPWYSGQGHSGCKFDGDPQVINYNGIDGGQMGLSANFREVGAWA